MNSYQNVKNQFDFQVKWLFKVGIKIGLYRQKRKKFKFCLTEF